MKFSFNAEGLTLLQQWLYAQTDEALALEAAALHHDFKAWVAAHFELSSQQLDFLKQLDAQSVLLFAAESAFAIGNRLSVSLDKEKDGDEQGKVIWTSSSLRAKNAYQHFEASGQLSFHIRYQ